VQYSNVIDQWSVELVETPDTKFTAEYIVILSVKIYLLKGDRERRKNAIYKELLKIIPGLEERLMTGSDNELIVVAELVGVVNLVSLPLVLISHL
jgi:hypothetical protein